MKRKPMLILAGLLVLVLLLAAFGSVIGRLAGRAAAGDGLRPGMVDTTDDRATAEAFLSGVPTRAASSTATHTAAGGLVVAVNEALGPSNREVNAGRKLTAVGLFDDEGTIGVTWALDDHFTPGMVLSLGQRDAERILAALASADVPFITLTLAGTFPMQDAAGDVAETVVVQAAYAHDDLREIAWDDFDATAVFREPLPLGVYIHPEFAE